ncbi:MAG: ATP synthase F1 subunit gamma [Oscillospiraceae bacterium]
MASIREIKLRIKSVGEMQKITKSMKLISVSKLKKARQQLETTVPYFNKVKDTMIDILTHSAGIENYYFDTRSDKKNKTTGIVVLSGDKGLAGGYNHNILKLTEEIYKKEDNPVLYLVGNIGREYFSKGDYNCDDSFDYTVQIPTFRKALEITDIILGKFKKGELDRVYLVYTQMISTLNLQPRVYKILPLNLEDLKENMGIKDESIKVDSLINYEPTPNSVFDVLIPKYINGIVYGALVEAFTSEQSARMTAMDNASSNANEMLQDLTLYYNRARQAAITQEISEIVGGASAL